MLWLSADSFKINFQEYHLSGEHIGSRSGGLIWVQPVCKSYQQTTLGGKKLKEQIVILASQKSKKCVIYTRKQYEYLCCLAKAIEASYIFADWVIFHVFVVVC